MGLRMVIWKRFGLEVVGCGDKVEDEVKRLLEEWIVNWLDLGIKCEWWVRRNDILICGF